LVWPEKPKKGEFRYELQKRNAELYVKEENLFFYVEQHFYLKMEWTDKVARGEPHVKRILALADDSVPKEIKETFNIGEIFLLLCSIVCHDIGYKVKEGEDISLDSVKEMIARDHAFRSAQFLRDGKMKIPLEWPERNILSLICEAHSRTFNIDDGIPEEAFAFRDWKIDLKFLSGFLRFIDDLDLSWVRVTEINAPRPQGGRNIQEIIGGHIPTRKIGQFV
jgi:uncharacterized protein YbaR (Trm112 family)